MLCTSRTIYNVSAGQIVVHKEKIRDLSKETASASDTSKCPRISFGFSLDRQVSRDSAQSTDFALNARHTTENPDEKSARFL